VTGRGRLPLSRILAQHRDPTYRSPPGRGRAPDGLEIDDIRASQNFVSEMARRYDRTSLTSGDTILTWTARGTVAVR